MKTNNLHEIAKKISDSAEVRGDIEARNNLHEKGGYRCLLILAKDDNVSKEEVNNLLRYYTDKLGWGMDKALNYTIVLFANGTIAQIKALNKEKSDD